MSKKEFLLKKIIYISIVVLSISLIIFGGSMLLSVFNSFKYNYPIVLLLISVILMTSSSISIYACTIVMIVKICTRNDLSTGDKVLWAILTYLFNSFVLPFSFNKVIAKTDDNADAIKLVILEGISVVIFVLIYLASFAKMAHYMQF